MKANSGLYRRIAYTFDFTDYSPSELAHIFDELSRSAGFRLSDELLADGRAALARQIEAETLPEARAQMNGGLCERMFDFAKQALDRREAARPKGSEPPSVILTAADVAEACARIPPPPSREGAADDVGGPPPAAGADSIDAEVIRRLQAENRSLKAENRRLQQAGSSTGGSTSGPTGGSTGGSTSGSTGCSTVAAPEKYEASACLRYSCGCAAFFFLAFIVWAWDWLRCIATFCWKWLRVFAAWCWKQACAFYGWAVGGSSKETEVGGSVVKVHPAPEKPPDGVVPTSPVQNV